MIWLQQVAYYRLTAKSNTTQDWDWEGNEIGTGRERGRGWEGTRSGLGGERSGLGGERGRGWGGERTRGLHLISSEALLSSALVQNSAQLSCKPDSRKLPVDFSSIPAMSLREQKQQT